MNAFIAFPKDQDAMVRSDYIEQIRPSLDNINAVPHDSADVFQRYFADCGSWDSFIEKVVVGADFYTREPLFQLFICTQRVLGRASAQLVERFLQIPRPVFYCEINDGVNFYEVSSVITEDPENWVGGWSLKLSIDS